MAPRNSTGRTTTINSAKTEIIVDSNGQTGALLHHHMAHGWHTALVYMTATYLVLVRVPFPPSYDYTSVQSKYGHNSTSTIQQQSSPAVHLETPTRCGGKEAGGGRGVLDISHSYSHSYNAGGGGGGGCTHSHEKQTTGK